MEIVYRKLSDIKPNPKNPRKRTKEAVEKLAESIKANPQFFEARPILLSDRTGELVIIGGERRSEAAALLNLESVPTILLSGLTEEQEDEIMVRDNTHAGEWDNDKIKSLSEQWGKEMINKWGGVIENWLKEDEMPKDFDAPPKNAPFVVKITFSDGYLMSQFIEIYKQELEDTYGCIISASGGEL